MEGKSLLQLKESDQPKIIHVYSHRKYLLSTCICAMVYSSIQHNYCIASIAGKSLKNHSEPRCTQRKSILSSVQHTFSVPEKLPHRSKYCKMRTPPNQISRTHLLLLPKEHYCCYHIHFIPSIWKPGAPGNQPLLSNASV